MIRNDAVILGIIFVILGLVFKTADSKRLFFVKFYKVVPPLLLCYFIPSILTAFHIVDASDSGLYTMASRYLLPACLVLLTLSIDLKAILKLGNKALVMFLTGTAGVITGGPIAMMIVWFFAPEVVGGEGADAVWRGLSAIAGSWIGGSANQAAMYEIFQPSDHLFSLMITVDIVIAEIWMAFLLFGAGRSEMIDRWLKADGSALSALKSRMQENAAKVARNPSLSDLMVILGIAFGVTALSHVLAGWLTPFFQDNYPVLERFSLTTDFFWIVVLATFFGMGLSFTGFRTYEGAGASRIGSIFIYFLVATIGMKMDIFKILDSPWLFLVGAIWMAIHAGLLIVVGRLIRAPFFYLAVGSQANIGGAASAPLVAAAFHPSLASVGVLLAVLGYALGTYGGWLTGLILQWLSGVLAL